MKKLTFIEKYWKALLIGTLILQMVFILLVLETGLVWEFIIQLVATFLGILIAFELNKEFNLSNDKLIYKNLRSALKLEFNNNKKMIERGGTREGISFETFKMVISNEFFVDGILKEEGDGEKLIEDLWDVVSGLREIKACNELMRYRNEEGGIKGYKKFKKIAGRL
jgi:hypothetical protein